MWHHLIGRSKNLCLHPILIKFNLIYIYRILGLGRYLFLLYGRKIVNLSWKSTPTTPYISPFVTNVITILYEKYNPFNRRKILFIKCGICINNCSVGDGNPLTYILCFTLYCINHNLSRLCFFFFLLFLKIKNSYLKWEKNKIQFDMIYFN